MSNLMNDVRLGLRLVRRAPGFALAAAGTLALGIGATSLVWSVAYGVLFKPLPYPEPERLVAISHIYRGRRAPLSPTNFLDFQAATKSLQASSIYVRGEMTLTGVGEPVRVPGVEVGQGFFDVLGVRATLGRTLEAAENEPGQAKVAVLGNDLWRSRFGSDAGIIGRTITLNGEAHTVVGVMPRGFSFPADRALWTPIELTPDFRRARGAWYLGGIGRLKPDVVLAAASAEAETIGSRLAREYPNDNEGVGLGVTPLRDVLVGDTRLALLVLLGSVGFLLLIACANVAHLALARALTRGPEMAVRAALGAGRRRLVAQLLTESLVLAGLGGLLGVALAAGGLRVLKAAQPGVIPRLDEIGLDVPVLAFAAAVTIVCGALFGCLPALRAAGGSLTDALREGGRGTVGGSGRRTRGALVVAEMALAMLLLAGAGLLMRSFVKLRNVDPGLVAENVLTFAVSTPESAYATPESRRAFYERLTERLRALPGVQHAAATSGLPLSGSLFGFSFIIEGRPPVPPAQEPTIQVRTVTPDYFAALGIPLKKGRLLAAADREGTAPVLLISESAARRFFPNEEPLGQRLRLGWGEIPKGVGVEIVGVVGDVKVRNLESDAFDTAYLPHAQVPVTDQTIVLKSAVPPLALAQSAAAAVRELDPQMPVSRVRSMDAVIGESVSRPRFYMALLTAFAALALALAAVGIFGVTSYAASQRIREIGIRMTIGASGRDVLRLVLAEVARTGVLGLLLGVAASLALSRALQGLLFRLAPTDPPAFIGSAVALGTVAALAALVPALRASRTDPAEALRAD